MAQIKYTVTGIEAVETVPDEMVDYYRERGYTIVVDEEAAAELKGAELDEAARELAGITDPGHTSADEKRAAVVAATAPKGRHAGETEEK